MFWQSCGPVWGRGSASRSTRGRGVCLERLPGLCSVGRDVALVAEALQRCSGDQPGAGWNRAGWNGSQREPTLATVADGTLDGSTSAIAAGLTGVGRAARSRGERPADLLA